MQRSNLLQHFPSTIRVCLGQHIEEPATRFPPQIASRGRGTSQPSPAFQREFIVAKEASKVPTGFEDRAIARPMHQDRLVNLEGATSILLVAVRHKNGLSPRGHARGHREQRLILQRHFDRGL